MNLTFLKIFLLDQNIRSSRLISQENNTTLHCAIVEPFDTRFHYHLSDDTKHDSFYVDQVLRDIIIKYDIKDEGLWIQSDNAPTKHKNKHAFALLQKLADDFNLRIIRT